MFSKIERNVFGVLFGFALSCPAFCCDSATTNCGPESEKQMAAEHCLPPVCRDSSAAPKKSEKPKVARSARPDASLRAGIESAIAADSMQQTRNYYLAQACSKPDREKSEKSAEAAAGTGEVDNPIELDDVQSVDPCASVEKNGISEETELQRKRTEVSSEDSKKVQAVKKDFRTFYGCAAGLDADQLKDSGAFERASKGCLQSTKLKINDVFGARSVDEIAKARRGEVADEEADRLARQADSMAREISEKSQAELSRGHSLMKKTNANEDKAAQDADEMLRQLNAQTGGPTAVEGALNRAPANIDLEDAERDRDENAMRVWSPFEK